MHHQRDEGHHDHHHRGQRVDQEADLHLQVADGHPLVHGAVVAGAVHHVEQHHHRQHEGNGHAQDGRGVGHDPAAARLRGKQAKELGTEQAGDR
ncbi:hypothetical protein D3C81_1888250 [compost metagenome]